jgi:hypothetical protein
MTHTTDFEKKADELLPICIQRSECSICNTENAECIKIDTKGGEKAVCLVCSNAIIINLIEFYEKLYGRSKPVQDKPAQENHKHKIPIPKVKPPQTSLEELLQHQYYEMLDLGVPISQIAIALKIPIEALNKYVEKWEEENRKYVAKWEEEDRIKENKELQDSN